MKMIVTFNQQMRKIAGKSWILTKLQSGKAKNSL